MNKLKIFWKSRKTWNYAFIEWQLLMFPHLFPEEWDVNNDAYWFYEALNNYDGELGGWL